MAEHSELRAVLWEGCMYVFRGVFEDVEDGKRELVSTEYATMPHISMSDHSIVWKPCIEGFQRGDIEAFAHLQEPSRCKGDAWVFPFRDIEPLGGEF